MITSEGCMGIRKQSFPMYVPGTYIYVAWSTEVVAQLTRDPASLYYPMIIVHVIPRELSLYPTIPPGLLVSG